MLRRVLPSFLVLALIAGCGSDSGGPATQPTPDAGAVDVSQDTGGQTDVPEEDTVEPDVPDEDAVADTEPDIVIPIGSAVVRMVHVSPDTPTLDIWIDGEAPGSGSPWAGLERYEVAPDSDAPDAYIEFEERQYVFDLVPEGGTLEDSLLSTRWNMTDGAIYTMWISGLSGYDSEIPEGFEELQLVGLVDDLGVPEDTATGEPAQRVRFIHSVIGAGNLDFSISGEKVDENLQFTWYSFDEHLLPLGEFTFGFSLAGDPEPLLAVPMEFGQWTTNVWAGGLFDQGEFWFVVLGPDNSIERRLEIIPEFFDARFVHASDVIETASPDGIDVYRGAELLADGAKFGEVTEGVEVEAGRHRFQAFAAGANPDEAEPLGEMGNRTYEAETDNTVVFFDDGTDTDATLVTLDSEAPADARVFVHAAGGIGPVTFADVTDEIAPGDSTDPIVVAAGETQFVVNYGESSVVFQATLGDEAGTVLVLTQESSVEGGVSPILMVVEADGSVEILPGLR